METGVLPLKSMAWAYGGFFFAWLSIILPLAPPSQADTLPERPSLYGMTSLWRAQTGQTMKLDSFKGKPVILAMAYTNCEYSCPLIFNALQKIEANIHAESPSVPFSIVVISLDAKRDTAAKLAEFMRHKGLNEKTWSLLTATDQRQVREMAVSLNIHYKELENGEFSHDNAIIVLDGEGREMARFTKFGTAAADILKLIVHDAKSKSIGPLAR